MKIRRVGAYGICRDPEGRVLLARNSGASEFPGQWTLPGGGVEQGEHPDDAVVREFAEETGLRVRIDALRTVTADVLRLPAGPLEHTDRLVYDVTALGGTLRNEADGTTDLVEWVRPDDLAGLPLMPFTGALLGRSEGPPPAPGSSSSSASASASASASDEPMARPDRIQRFSTYASATDPAGRVLLTRIAAGFPGGGLWHLPGGGTDHGETPEQALAREMYEETAQRGRVTDLLGVSHRHNPAAFGPEGRPIDWHVIRVLFRVEVDRPTEPVVTEGAGGSTAAAGWFRPGELGKLRLTDVAQMGLGRLQAGIGDGPAS